VTKIGRRRVTVVSLSGGARPGALRAAFAALGEWEVVIAPARADRFGERLVRLIERVRAEPGPRLVLGRGDRDAGRWEVAFALALTHEMDPVLVSGLKARQTRAEVEMLERMPFHRLESPLRLAELLRVLGNGRELPVSVEPEDPVMAAHFLRINWHDLEGAWACHARSLLEFINCAEEAPRMVDFLGRSGRDVLEAGRRWLAGSGHAPPLPADRPPAGPLTAELKHACKTLWTENWK
jgi:hypothetical protein